MERIDHAREAMRIIDEGLAEQDRQFEALEKAIEQNGIEEDEANQLYYNWIKHGRSVVTEADVLIEGSPDVVFYDPNQMKLWE